MGGFKIFRNLLSRGPDKGGGIHSFPKSQGKTPEKSHKKKAERALSAQQKPSAAVGFFYIHGIAGGSGSGFRHAPENISKTGSKISKILSGAAIAAIRFYQRFVSPVFPHTCRFYPTCSEYSVQAISKYGILKGGLMSIWRIIRCNPLNPGGYDPVK